MKDVVMDAAWARRVLTNTKNFDYQRDADGKRVGRTRCITLSAREAHAIAGFIAHPDRPRPNIDMTLAMLRGPECGHLVAPTPEQVEQARDVIEDTYKLNWTDAATKVASKLQLKHCSCKGCAR